MIPSVEYIIHKRHAKRRQLRMCGLVLVMLSLFWFGTVLFGRMLSGGSLYSIFNDSDLAVSLALLLPAAVVLCFDRRLARALVLMPNPICPRCEYRILKADTRVCTECGLVLPPGISDEPASAAQV